MWADFFEATGNSWLDVHPSDGDVVSRMKPWHHLTRHQRKRVASRNSSPEDCSAGFGVLLRQPKCLELAAEEGGQIIMVHKASHNFSNLMSLPAPLSFWAPKSAPKLRAVYQVRSVNEIIVSAYFYHLGVANETWLVEKPFKHLLTVYCDCVESPACDGANKKLSLAPGICERLVSAFGWRPDSWGTSEDEPSYRDLLEALPMESGVLLEAYRTANPTSSDPYPMQRLESIMRTSTGREGAVSDLDALIESESSCLESALGTLQHLGTLGDATACAATFCELAQEGSNGPHSTSAVPAARKAAARAVLKESAWFNALPAEVLMGAHDEAELSRV